MRTILLTGILGLAISWMIGCDAPTTENDSSTEANVASNGFDPAQSDPEAIELAKNVIEASGGQSQWDKVRHLQWTFFGRRTLWWDKQDNLCRIHFPADEMTLMIDLDEKTGQVALGDSLYNHPDTVQKYLDIAYRVWVNDSYWLVMPFKMMDPGVQLKYLGADTTANGIPAQVVEMTYENVGVTPQNKYHVYVDEETSLIAQWDYFSTATDSEPRLSTPWKGYQEFGGIQLSGDRGAGMQLSNIAVFETVDPNWYKVLNAQAPE
jgi:hypothetical protein